MGRNVVRTGLVLTVLCSLTATSAAERWYRWPQITAEEAAQIVRDFAGDPGLELSYQGIASEAYDWMAPWHFGLVEDYVFEAGNREYRVGVRDPLGISFIDASDIVDPEGYYGQPFDEQALHTRQMAVEDARPLADAFVAAHHPGFRLLTVYYVASHPTEGREDSVFAAYYTFYYQQVLDNGAIAPSGATVSVDSVFGNVVAYSQVAYPVIVDWHPLLAEQDAIDVAVAVLLYGEVTETTAEALEVTTPDAFGLERLVWRVEVGGRENLTQYHLWSSLEAWVDAHTGDLVYWQRFSDIGGPSTAAKTAPMPETLYHPPARLMRAGRPVAAAYPPISVAGRTYLYILNLPGLGAEMELLGPGRATLKTAKATGYVDAKRGVLTLNDRPFLRYGKPLIIRGRTYVPLDFARRLLGDVSLTVRRAPPPE